MDEKENSALRLVKTAVMSRLRREGFVGRWPSFRKPFADNAYGLVRFLPDRTPTTSATRPCFMIETALMREGDETQLGKSVRGFLLRLIPEGFPWPDTFEYPEDIVDETTAAAFADAIVREVLEQGPELWANVRWWEPDRNNSVLLHHRNRWAARQPVVDLKLLENAWNDGTATMPDADVVEWLRKAEALWQRRKAEAAASKLRPGADEPSVGGPLSINQVTLPDLG